MRSRQSQRRFLHILGYQSRNTKIAIHDETQGVPGHLVRSVFPDSSGNPILSTSTYRTTWQSPLKERWGGWSVSGTHGRQRHMGNMIVKNTREPEAFDADAGANLTDLSKLFNVDPYLTPHSDIVAFLVLEHQSPAHNALTLANYQTKLALRDEEILQKMDKAPHLPRPDGIQRRLDHSADLVLKHFLFVDETPLTDRVQGSTGYAEQFAARGSWPARQARPLTARLQSANANLPIPVQLSDLLRSV